MVMYAYIEIYYDYFCFIYLRQLAIDILIRIINAHIDAIQKDAKQSDQEVRFDTYTFSP